MPLYKVKLGGPAEVMLDAEDPQAALAKGTEVFNDIGFEVYLCAGGSGKAGERLLEIEKSMEPKSNIIIPELSIRPQ